MKEKIANHKFSNKIFPDDFCDKYKIRLVMLVHAFSFKIAIARIGVPGVRGPTLVCLSAIDKISPEHFLNITVYWSFSWARGRGPYRVVVSTAAFHARVRGSVPSVGGLKEAKCFFPIHV